MSYNLVDDDRVSSLGYSLDFAILMCTFNGEKYISDQLNSILKQDNKSWKLFVSDDGSSDGTLDLLQKFQHTIKKDRLNISCGPKKGFSRNFFSLIYNKNIQAKYYVLADQDDIWHEKKLSAALNYFRTIPETIPALYCCRTIFVNERNEFLGFSYCPRVVPSFSNALVQNIASGNTMIFNSAARNLIIRSSCSNFYVHDWGIYLILSACGGEVFFDEKPYVRYRQHASNQIGMNLGLNAKINRFYRLISGDFRQWNDCHIENLRSIQDIMTAENRRILESFCRARAAWGPRGIYYLAKSGAHRQDFFQNFALYFGAFIGRI